VTRLLALAAVGAVEVSRLANGIPVLCERETGAATVSIGAVVRTDDLTPRELDAVEALVDSWHGGTESLTLHRLNALAAQSGGRIVVAQAADCVRFDATVPRESFPLVVTLLSELFLRPQISVDSIRDGRDQRRRALPIAEHPLEQGVRALLHSEGLLGSGTPSDAPEEVEAVWRKVFRPERVAIGVVGDVALEQVVQRIGASLGSWQPTTAPRGGRARTGESGRAMDGWQQVVGVLLRGPPPTDARFAAFLVGIAALLEGKGSIVGREIRYGRSLAYETGVLRFVRGGSTWAFYYLGLSEGPLGGQALSLIQAGVERITDDELERGKAYLLGALKYRGGCGSLLSSLSGASMEPFERAHRYAWLQAFAVRGGMSPGLEQKAASVQLSEVREVMAAAAKEARVLAAGVKRAPLSGVRGVGSDEED